MEIYRTPSKEIQEIILASVTYETVINGLNGYFASEPRNDYITVKMVSDKQNSALYEPEAWADIMITWLRTKHGIFYYPGMEAKYAKMEKIPSFTKRMMNEGAFNSLKKLYKNVTGEEDKTDSPTLIVSTISCNFSNKDKTISVLKEQIELLKGEVRNLNAELATKWTKTSLIDWLQQEARHKGVELDDAFLYSDDAQYDWTDIVDFLFDEIVKMRREIKSKESGIEDLKEHITLLEADLKKAKIEKEKLLIEVVDREEEIESLQNKDYDVYLEHRQYIIKSIMCDIHQDASRNGFNLPEEIDGEPLSIERTFHDLLELLMKRTKEIREVNDKRWKDLRDINKALGYDGMDGHVDDFAMAVKARAECTKRALGEESDINKLIRDYCTEHGIVAPSRYFSDKACIEYLFSVSVSILQDLYRDIFKKQPDGLSVKDIANKILNKVSTKDDEISQLKALINAIDSVKESRGKIRAEIENYKLKLKDYILKDIKEHGYRYDGLETKSIEEIVDWIIMLAACDRSGIALRDIYTTVASPVERRRYNIDDCDGATASHMKDYILRRFEGLHANTEYCLKKMSELDGYKKHFETLKEKQEFLVKQNSELSCKICAKDDEISRLKGLINAMNKDVGDM